MLQKKEHQNFRHQIPPSGGGGAFFLIGFMASGKTHLGGIWAAKYNLTFYDLDALIEQAENQTIAQIFTTQGEAYFRKIETEALLKTKLYKNAIIACGGGTACFNNNMEWMNNNGKTIFLNQSQPTILNNIIKDKNVRPLVANQTPKMLQNFIAQKMKERLPFYNQSNIILQPEQLHENGLEGLL